MYPYPSGAGLHAGHAENFTGGDVLARYKWARGFNVLHPMGWDAFGLPAEQYALKTGTHPAETTATNVTTFRRQLKALGLAVDWSREINTTDPAYVRWTQWIFLKLFQHGLATVGDQPVNFCPALGTVLANEEVIDGKSEVGGHPVERRRIRQWVLRITAYAEKLLEGHAQLDWPESSLKQQQHWIGRSTGAEVTFTLPEHDTAVTVFTTRPDTLFGASYLVLAPEHPLVEQITSDAQRTAVEAYVRASAAKSDLDRTELAQEKTGVDTGASAVNPVDGTRVPIWIADYVLMSYGTGAIMAVPAHDERDHAFAEVFELPIRRVVQGEGAEADAPLPWAGVGKLIDSGPYTGLSSEAAKAKIVADLAAQGSAQATVNYRLRDWLFSRQRYWGEPFPILWIDAQAYERLRAIGGPLANSLPPEPVTYDDAGRLLYAVPLPEDALPLELPQVERYAPSGTGESPLANAPEWLDVWLDLETGATQPRAEVAEAPGPQWVEARRETNTMPQWAGSCWYYLRYMDPHNPDHLVAPDIARYWGPVDFYMGGAEHVNLHLLYARFWHRFLYDIGVVPHPEPFQRLYHQGMILGTDGEKMSKSRGNVVNPDDVIASHGADALRLYLMFMGPLEDAKPWQTQGIEGVSRFLKKVWRECIGQDGQISPKLHTGPEAHADTHRLLHQTIKKATEDYEAIRFNTVVSQLMIFMNHIGKVEGWSVESARDFVRLLAPLAPHLAEELWERLGQSPSVLQGGWPEWDEAALSADTVQLGLLVNGKPRGELQVPAEATEPEVLALARAQPRFASHIEGKTVRKVIYVPGKILNVVVS